MHDLVIVYSFAYQHQLLTVRAQMEAEGIETFTENEFTVQVDPLYSTAIGGIKLLVHSADAARATEVLLAHGFNPNPVTDNDAWLEKLNTATENMPFIGSLDFSWRMLILSGLFAFIVAAIIYKAAA